MFNQATILIKIILVLGFLHSISDLALQTPWMAQYKSPLAHYTDYNNIPKVVWPIVLLGHSMINGAVYFLGTGSLLIGCLETGLHFAIDYGSSSGKYGLLVDQILHGVCILIYALILFYRR